MICSGVPELDETGTRRHVFVGDVQGCWRELEGLLEAVDFEAAHDALVSVGDVVNRGPDSAETLRLLRSIGARLVLGNHDLHLLRVAEGGRRPRSSDTFGDVLDAEDREELLTWLAAQPFARMEAGCLVVHAGLHPKWEDPIAELAGLDPLEPHPATDFATRVRFCTAKGKRPKGDVPPPKKPFRPWYEFRESTKPTVVFGHWAARGLVVEKGLRGLDTGCVWGGRLTAWIAEEDRLVHVDARRAYQSVGD